MRHVTSELTKFPFKHVDDNLLFTYSGEVWAFFRVAGFSYDLESYTTKMTAFYNQMDYLSKQVLDLQFLAIPNQSDASAIIDEHIKRLEFKKANQKYDLFENGVQMLSAYKKVFKQKNKTKESRTYQLILGVQLNPQKNKFKKGNKGNQAISNFRTFIKGLSSGVDYAVGFDGNILDETVQAYKQQSRSIERSLSKVFSAGKTANNLQNQNKPVSAMKDFEVAYMVESNYSATPTAREILFREDLPYAEEITVDHEGQQLKAYKPNREKYQSLQSGLIREYDENTLVIKKRIKSKTETMYARCIVASKFEDKTRFPNKEWIYKLQKRVNFPFTMSMRTHYKPNEKTVKELSNVELEISAEQAEAIKAGQKIDRRVQTNEGKLVSVKEMLETNGLPSYQFSVVFKINAKDIDTLNARTEQLETELRKFQIEAVAPLGEQPALFMEQMPGGKQYLQDYQHDAEPGFFASAMFGATNSLGDDKGFPIGRTTDGKIVYIFPELSAKGFDNGVNKNIGLGTMVAGQTGFGKSVLMNYLSWWGALTGSFVFVLDPKGDRKNWENGLPYIPKENIRVWTLGKSRKDDGSLDPFKVNEDRGEAIDSASNIFEYLLKAEYGTHKSNILSEAIMHASTFDDRCMEYAIEFIGHMKDQADESGSMIPEKHNALTELYEAFIQLQTKDFTSLLIAKKGQHTESLSFDKPVQVLMLENMNLPKKEKSPKEYTQDEHIATAIMLSLGGFLKKFMITDFGEKIKRHKFALFDETSALEANASGSQMLDDVVRQGRYYNMSLLKGSQNATDHGRDAPNMSMKFSFRQQTTEEAKTMLQTLNLEITDENIAKLKSLPQGTCLFQDINGRTDQLVVDLIFQELFNAFQTDTSSEEERDFERELSKAGAR
ncbi:ATP-binding protein [Staphylococcus xylosus]|uniref:ATP-binding protein n=1 Tax=Staphylococcus xylosus TaxID=1288 RepID=UPI003F544957